MTNLEAESPALPITSFLHLFVLASFGLAQPLYELLGRTPEFFSAHRASPIQVVLVILVLSAGPGIVVVIAALSARALDEKSHRIVRAGLVFLLVSLIAAAPTKRWMAPNDLAMAGFVFTIALVFTAAYVRSHVVRSFVSALSPAVLFFPLWFVFATPVNGLVFPRELAASDVVRIEKPAPVVVVVFDELSMTSLLNSKGSVDGERFPNFGSIASESYWFPNAVAVSQATAEAIPSILTGRSPRPEERLLPVASDYPNNIFTLLSGSYTMNVTEAVTSIYHRNDASSEEFAAILLDIAVIYLHLVLPPKVSQQLPQLDDQWTGFGASIRDKKSDKGEQKVKQLQRFLANIEAGGAPQFHFIHTLLPHTPYQFLASGHKYTASARAPDGLISNSIGWTTSETLLVTGYHRYLQQLGYVDSIVGDIKNRLVEAGIYDQSLVVITADHGVSFQKGQSRRRANAYNANEILNIPLFIKLPNQVEGEVKEELVSSLDVLPTIVDILQAEVPWKFEGQSVFSERRPPLAGIDIPRAGHFDKDTVLERARLNWKIENFGERTSLDRLIPQGPHPELSGRSLDNVRIGEGVDLLLSSNDLMNFDNIDKGGAFLPALFTGYVEGSTRAALPIAIALNGTIWATTITTQWDERDNYFSVLLPADAFVQGQNVLKSYVVDLANGETTLRPLREELVRVSLRSKRGVDRLVFPDGNEIVVSTDRRLMDGYSEVMAVRDNMVVLQGWAADLVDVQPASNILIFAGEKLVWRMKPNRKRADVVEMYPYPSLLRSGYYGAAPLKSFMPSSGLVRVIALSGDRRAFRLAVDSPPH